MGGDRYQTGTGSIFTFFLVAICGALVLAAFSVALIVGVISVQGIALGWPLNLVALLAWLAFAIWFLKPRR